jgi:hypothetical protein
MKKIVVLLILSLSFSKMLFAQESSFMVITGLRVNPMVVIDSDGNRQEFTRLHTEIGTLLNQKIYLSVGYTPFVNSIFTFNEYWFLDFKSSLPISVVGILEHNFDKDKSFYNLGFNFKLKNGNGIVMVGSQFEKFDPIYKVGAFIPLSWIIFQE